MALRISQRLWTPSSNELHDAKEYGSILTVTPQDWSALYNRFAEITEDINMSRETALRELLPLVQVAEALAQNYDAVVTNPPYMGASGMSGKLSSFVKEKISRYEIGYEYNHDGTNIRNEYEPWLYFYDKHSSMDVLVQL